MAIFVTPPIFAENNQPKKVVIVGAGLAGLTTAYRLQQNGMEVDVYEARNRVGGRILTVKIGDKIAELGAQSIINDGASNHILRLIEELNLDVVENKVNRNQSYFDGKELIPLPQLLKNKQFDPKELRIQLNNLALTSKNMREVLNGILEEEDPFYKVLAVRLANYEGAAIEKLSTYYTEALYHMLLSALAAARKEEENFTSLLSIKGGNALLPEKLAQKLEDKLHFNQVLKIISKQPDDSFILTFQNGLQVKADIVVLAMPSSVYENIIFEENILPSKRLDDMKSVKYGTNAKIMIPFFHSPPKGIRFNNDDVGCAFDISNNILTLHYINSLGPFSSETILDIYKQNRCMIETVFRDTCPPFASPVIAEDKAFAIYKGPIGYSWPTDPYAKGSYFYIAPGQESLLMAVTQEQEELVRTLFAPIDQKLYFVGEHTSILKEAFGTMEAACESGERISRLILKANGA